MSLEPLYRLVDDHDVKVRGMTIACEKAVEYPSTFFLASRKPTMNVYYKSKTLDDLRKSIYAGMLQSNVSVFQAIAYLYKLFTTRTELNSSDWVSYRTKIASAQTEINPFVMVNVNEHDANPDELLIDANANPLADSWIPYILVFIFRVTRVSHDSYKAILIESVSKQAVGIIPGVSLEALSVSSGSWINNADYCKIIASLDMFYYRFQKSIYSNIRIGTISARFRECAALTSYQHLTKVMGAPTMGSMFEWVFNHTVKDDILRIFKDGEELDKEFSYFPYQIDFGLVQKSAYSASVNSGLYVWGNIICVLNKDIQSRNARALSFSNITDVVWNAKLIGYVKSNRVSSKIFFTRDSELEDPAIVGAPARGQIGSMPSSANPVMWFNYMKLRNFDFPQECEAYFNSVKSSIQDPRPGTIGEYIKDFL